MRVLSDGRTDFCAESRVREGSAKGGETVKKRITALIISFAIALLCLSSCGSDTATVLRFGTETQAVTFDPQIAEDGTAKMIVRNTFEGLVRPDADGEISEGVAEKWDISPDGLTYTFYLREDAAWHLTKNAVKQLEGKLPEGFYTKSASSDIIAPKVTAADFVFALRRALDPATNAPDAGLLSSVVNAREVLAGTKSVGELGVSAPDERTLVIKLSERNDAFLSVLTEPVCMPCNETFFNACGGRYGLLIAYSMSNGPFYLSFFDETTYRVRKSTDYSGAHAAKADTLWFYYRTDADTVLQKLADKEYSGAYVTDAQLKSLSVGKTDEVIQVADTNRVFLINNKNEKLAIKELRDAFLYATDVSSIAADANETAAVFPVPDAACEDGATPPVSVYDESKVSDALDKALEVYETDSLTLTVLCEKKDSETLRRQLQRWQRVFGIRLEIKLEEVDRQTLLSRVAGSDWEIAFYPLRVSSDDAGALFGGFMTESPSSLTGTANEKLDSLISSYTASAGDARTKLLSEICSLLVSDGAVLPVWKETSCFVCTEGVHGVYVGAGADRRYFENAYIDK